jgi:hypothetical protein
MTDVKNKTSYEVLKYNELVVDALINIKNTKNSGSNDIRSKCITYVRVNIVQKMYFL